MHTDLIMAQLSIPVQVCWYMYVRCICVWVLVVESGGLGKVTVDRGQEREMKAKEIQADFH